MVSDAGRLMRLTWRTGLLAVAVASVAGCVSMPDSGPVSAVSAGPTAAGQSAEYTGSFPAAPERGWTPEQVVTGFLFASANPSDQAVAKEYLTPQAAATWNPWQSVTVLADDATVAPTTKLPQGLRDGQVVTVVVSGTVQATLNSSGQYITATAAQQPGGCGKPGAGCDAFKLVYTGGQWRIENPPPFLLLYSQVFGTIYQPLNLYWFTPGYQKLVPDSVYVPLSAAPQQVLTKLVTTLIQGPGRQDWLGDGATVSSFPGGTTVLGVIPSNTTAIVDLGGAITNVNPTQLGRISAQLAYTLAGLPGGQSTIGGIELEINGNPWPNTGEQTPSAFSQYEQYPGRNPASFTYVDNRGAMVSCGSILESGVPSVPVFRTAGVAQVASCGQAAVGAPASPGQAASTSPAKGHGNQGQATRPTTLSRIAISPDGKSLAEVAAAGQGKDTVTIGAASGRWNPQRWTVSGPVTSISWDPDGDLWVVGADGVQMITPSGSQVPVDFDGTVTALSIAPDGVRMAAILQPDSGQGTSGQVELLAISRGEQPGARNVQASTQVTVGTPVTLVPGISDPVALTWYDTTNLLVVNLENATTSLWQVPVDGLAPAAVTPPSLPIGQTVTAITADTTDNVIVAATSAGQLEVSDSTEGPWQVAVPGSAPLYGG